MRVLGVDLGDRRIGLAISDPTGTIAQGAGALQVRSEKEAIAALLEIAVEREITTLVLGLPLTMAGLRGERAQKTERFAATLRRKTALPIVLWDERFTTEAAKRVLRETDSPRKSKKKRTDEIAATLLLQSWLDSRGPAAGIGSAGAGKDDE